MQYTVFTLRGLDTWQIFCQFLLRRQFLWLPVCTISPFWKGIYSTRKEFAPFGSKFFPCRVDHFSEGRSKIFQQSCLPLKCINSNSVFRKTNLCKDGRPRSDVAECCICSGSCLFVLRFYGQVNPMGSCRARSVYLTTLLLGRLSPLSR